MASPMKHAVGLTDEQLQIVSSVFKEKGWSLNVSSGDRLQEMREAADDYVALYTCRSAEVTTPVEVANTLGQTDQRATMDPGMETIVETDPGRLSPTEATDAVANRPPPPPLPPPPGSPQPPPPPPSTSSPTEPGINPSCRSIKIDKNHKSFHSMKQAGSAYKWLRESSKGGAGQTGEAEKKPGNNRQWRVSTADVGAGDNVTTDSDLIVQHHCVTEDNMVKILTQFSTEHVKRVSNVPVRIVLLVDRSGSMLNRIGRHGRYAKITTVKRFASQLIANLDDGDEAGLVTFGETAQEFFPLQKLNRESKNKLQQKLQQLDKGSMSLSTNLSDGLRMALKCFYKAMSSPADYLSCKNSILVFSDGDINAGTVETNTLVHEVRQNIRQMAPTLDDTQNQWVTISVITTGSDISEQVYTLSKTCSSEAFYYVDQDTIDPEAELFLPVLLRKSAVAWNISCHFEAYHGITFDSGRSTTDNKIRLRRSFGGCAARAEKAYFLYDFPVGNSRQIGVCADWTKARMLSLEPGEVLFKVRIGFTNIKGERLWQEHTICKRDVEQANVVTASSAAKMAACKHDIRIVSTDILHAAAEKVKSGDKQTSVALMQNGTKDLQALLNKFGQDAAKSTDEQNASNAEELQNFAKSVVSNLGALIEVMDNSTDGAAWNRIKAVSTAISREAPTVSGFMSEGDVLCPLPHIDKMANTGIYDSYAKLKENSQSAQNKRLTFGNLDQMLDGVFSA